METTREDVEDDNGTDSNSAQSVDGDGSKTAQKESNHDKKPPAVTKKLLSSKFKKAPQAPRRFKSAFIFYSTQKHKEIRAQMGDQGLAAKTTNIAKLVSEAWRDLSPEEREKWQAMAERDKVRYEMEKSTYKGPWRVQANKRTPKDPSAPKRPMSAFLAFSNKRRGKVKHENPDLTNAEVSKTLSRMWKEAPDDLRQKYIDEELTKRNEYKAAMLDWKKKNDEDKRLARVRREDMALEAADAMHIREEDEDDEDAVSHPRENAVRARHNERSFLPLFQQTLPPIASMPMYGTGANFASTLFMDPNSAFSVSPMGHHLSQLVDSHPQAHMAAIPLPYQQIPGMAPFYGQMPMPSYQYYDRSSFLPATSSNPEIGDGSDPEQQQTDTQTQESNPALRNPFGRYGSYSSGWNFPGSL